VIDTLHLFMNGAVTLGCAVVGLFFLRFWRKSHDRLFMLFAIAFWLLGVNRVALTFVEADETRTYLYMVRLLAFLIILIAIVDKNRARKAPQ
jgi:hypothetical protein